MYECLMGIKNGLVQCGMILADETGLGKTLQTIVLVYTLINDGPFKGSLIKKCLIVTPSSLVGNWKKEFKKRIHQIKTKKLKVAAMLEKKKEKQRKIVENVCFCLYINNISPIL